jgi:hypothetical protein
LAKLLTAIWENFSSSPASEAADRPHREGAGEHYPEHIQFIELKPKVLQAFDRLIGEGMGGHDLCYQLALRL